ncbi:BTAD domain-containing putative transcriptional regulator [Streptomyces sp. NPDC085529]|uniref:AfsR/SARP family transcriptional regulator n=1 Tax=Streptomyces sp. NPDC085529 TaxID=3365729 RepID=UPI0037D01A5D
MNEELDPGNPSAPTRYDILGPLRMWRGGEPVAIRGWRPRAVLAGLLLERGGALQDDMLIDMVYGEEPPRSARNQIQQAIHWLRKAGAPVIRSENGYSLSVGDAEVDAFAFQAHIEQARTAMRSRLFEEAEKQYRIGLGMWRGEALSGFDTPYFRAAAASLEEPRLVALAEHAEALLELGRPHAVIAELRRLTTEHPLRERFQGQLMLALYRDGRQSEALDVYRDLRVRLSEELGVEPSPALDKLHRQMLLQDPLLEHPRAASAAAPSRVVPRQLPPRTGVLEGRDAELDRTLHALTGDGYPVVVLAGFGGTGKTALALHASHDAVAAFPDGQLFATLKDQHARPVRTEDVLGMFLRALGLRDPEVPAGLEERAARFRTLTAGRRILVVLDDAHTLKQIRPLLPGGDECAVVVTTTSWEISRPGWELVKIDPLGTADARRLLERSVGHPALEADPEAAREVLDRCGGLPLALEIVAARMAGGQVSLRRIAERLADRGRMLEELTAGDRTVRTVLDVGYRTLDARTQSLLRKIGFLGRREITVEMAAALEGAAVNDIGYRLDDLADAHFLHPARPAAPGARTYRCRDMVLAYGHELSLAEDATEDRAAALERARAWLSREADPAVPVRRAHRSVLGAPDGPRVPSR